MDLNLLKSAGINYKEGIERFAGREDLYEKYLLKFCKDPAFSLLKEAMQKNDYKNAFNYAHTLKGVSGNLSLGSFYDSICELTDELRYNPSIEVQNLFDEVEKKYQKVLLAFDQIK